MKPETRGRKKLIRTHKVCSRCKESLPLESFAKKERRQAAYCRTCDIHRQLDYLTDEQIQERISTHRAAILKLIHYMQTDRRRNPELLTAQPLDK